ncbi:MAG: winged helix-turn-helix domain-containing protein [Fervidicoccaceae archaeon]
MQVILISENRNLFDARIEILIASKGIVVGGKGLAELLREIEESGSLRSAAKKMGMNYKRAWLKIKMAEAKAMVPLVERRRGRGGYVLSDEGKEFLRVYEEVESKLKDCGFI